LRRGRDGGPNGGGGGHVRRARPAGGARGARRGPDHGHFVFDETVFVLGQVEVTVSVTVGNARHAVAAPAHLRRRLTALLVERARRRSDRAGAPRPGTERRV